jgi:B12-binding domain/radical SAM domain protein
MYMATQLAKEMVKTLEAHVIYGLRIHGATREDVEKSCSILFAGKALKCLGSKGLDPRGGTFYGGVIAVLPCRTYHQRKRRMYDVVLIHPPAIYDFRKRVFFPGPIAYTVRESSDQFIIPPIGMFSIAEFLERNGYKVLIDNLGDRMLYDRSFDVEQHLRKIDATVYGVGLHWSVHSQGALEVARLCKALHPNSTVVLGGLTATVFHVEIVRKFSFVDAVIRGEAEKPFLDFLDALEKRGKPVSVPNTTIREGNGKVSMGEPKKPQLDIDQLEFTRIDLLEPKRAFFNPTMPPHFSIPICRGCVYDCVTCGGSSYSYRTYLNRERPSFRSPERICEDLEKLSEQGVKTVFLFQDPRMAGSDYCERLVKSLRSTNLSLMNISIELFEPANKNYLKKLASIGIPLTLTISPESGVEEVRMLHGRRYSNRDLFKTMNACLGHGDSIRLVVFFMLGLASETEETAKETVRLWERICVLDGGRNVIMFAFGPMILLDPGSPAFDRPEEHGYRLVFKCLEDYVNGLSMPSWHQWISYETRFLNRADIADLTLKLIEYSINLREKYGIYSRLQALRERAYFVWANRMIIKEVEEVMKSPGDFERSLRLQRLKEKIDNYLGQFGLRLG